MSKYLKTREGSLEDLAKQMQNKVLESDYQDKFKKELDKAGRPIGQMTGAEKKAFFNKLDKMHTAKNEQVKNPYAIGMAQAMKAKDDQPPLKKSTITKAHDIAKSIEKDQKEEVSQKEIDKFHTSLDKLVHKSFGHSSDEKKKEKVNETHSFITNKQNQKQKEVGGEKEPIKTTKNEWKTFAMMAAELREKKEQKKEDKKEMQAGDDTRDKKQKTMTGEIATSPEMNPKVDYKY
jgi:hypothetical protein